MVRVARMLERRTEAALSGQPKFPEKPGNLIGGGPFIVSIGPREIVAYPRAAALLNEVKDRLAGADREPEDLLLAADLERMLDGGAAAKEYLAQLGDKALPEIADRRSQLLRAVLYQELAANQEDPTAILSELDKLSRTPWERGRFLQAQISRRITTQQFRGGIRVRFRIREARSAGPASVADRSDAFDVRPQLAGVAIGRAEDGPDADWPAPRVRSKCSRRGRTTGGSQIGRSQGTRALSGRPPRRMGLPMPCVSDWPRCWRAPAKSSVRSCC